MFAYTANNDSCRQHHSSVGLNAELVIIMLLVQCLYEALNANYLSGTLCDVEDMHRYLFHNGIYWRKKSNNQIKPSRHGTAIIFASGSGKRLSYV